MAKVYQTYFDYDAGRSRVEWVRDGIVLAEMPARKEGFTVPTAYVAVPSWSIDGDGYMLAYCAARKTGSYERLSECCRGGWYPTIDAARAEVTKRLGG